MITIDAAKAIGLKNHNIRIGAKANLIVLNQSNTLEALRFHDAPRFVISKGNIIDQDKYKAQF